MSAIAKCYYRLGATRLGFHAARAALVAVRKIGMLRKFHTALDALNLPRPAARELMRMWQRVHWSSGDGMMPPQELLAVYALACGAIPEGDLVELGSWKGLTTCYLAAACRARRNGLVHAVDTFAGTREFGSRYASIANYSGSTRAAFCRQIGRAGVAAHVCIRPGLTTEMAATYDGGPIAFLLIDADHSYDGVKADFETWAPLVAPGGTIVFHDYSMKDGGVRAYVQAEIAGRPGYRQHPAALPENLFVTLKEPVQSHQTSVRPNCEGPDEAPIISPVEH
jgi:predicted O-methyltransferase YrrM